MSLWHPFAAMSAVAGREIVIERGDGAWLYSTDGDRYLDATAGLWYCNVGHGREVLAEVAATQMRRLAGYQLFGRFANQPALDLADRLCALAPTGDGSAAFFTNGGSDAIDTAAKIARRYWTVQGQPDRRIVIAREGAYHGVNAFGTSLSGIEANAAGWGPLIREILIVPRDSLVHLEEVLEARSGQIAAFIGEPVQGAAGVHPPQPGYWEAAQELCRAHDVLLIADEVVTGFGRLGSWFGSERYGMIPDIITTAKGMSSGYLPIGAVIVSQRVRDVMWSREAGVFRHGYTYSGHPAACAVALENLAIIERERLVDRVAELEPLLAAEVAGLASHRLVADVRHAGLLAGVEIAEAARVAEPGIVDRIVDAAHARGVIVRNLVGRTLQISPPFVIDSDQLRLLFGALRGSLDDVADQLGDAAVVESA